MNKNKIAVDLFNKFATLYEEKYMDVTMYGDTFDFFCDAVQTVQPYILELACGPGNITKYLLDRRPDFNILATDLAPNMVERAKINNPTAVFKIMDCREIGQLTDKFDAIMCGFCLPYIDAEETGAFIAAASNIMKPGAVIYISTMEDDYSKSGFRKGSTGDEVFMYFYKEDFLVNVFEKNDFKIMKVDRKDFPSNDGSKVTDLVIIAKKL